MTIFMHSGGCQISSTQTSDGIFPHAISRFKERFPDSIKVNKFPSTRDSSSYVTNFLNLLDRKLKTSVFSSAANYSDFSFSTKYYDLTVHEIVLSKAPDQLNGKVINAKTEAPLQIIVRQFGNRILLFSFSPFKFNDNMNHTIKKFEGIYEEISKSAK